MDDSIILNICGKEIKFKKLNTPSENVYDCYDYEPENELYCLFERRIISVLGLYEIVFYSSKYQHFHLKRKDGDEAFARINSKYFLKIGTKEEIEQDLIFL